MAPRNIIRTRYTNSSIVLVRRVYGRTKLNKSILSYTSYSHHMENQPQALFFTFYQSGGGLNKKKKKSRAHRVRVVAVGGPTWRSARRPLLYRSRCTKYLPNLSFENAGKFSEWSCKTTYGLQGASLRARPTPPATLAQGETVHQVTMRSGQKSMIRVSAQNIKYYENCLSIPPLPTTNQIS